MKNSHSSSLFHFTRNFNSLVSIIQEGFRFSYSGEQITRASISGVPPTDNIFVALPMISFCDIPIELCEEHRSKYGDYAIGINKNQLIKHTGGLLSPVHYTLTDNPIRGAYAHHKAYIEHLKRKNEILAARPPQDVHIKGHNGIVYTQAHIFDTKKDGIEILSAIFFSWKEQEYASFSLGFTKNYFCSHNGNEFCAYDECEWRIIIPEDRELNGIAVPWFWSEEKYKEWKQSQQNTFLDWDYQLKLPDEYITDIIVPSQEDCSIIANILEKNGQDSLTNKIRVI